MEQSGDMMKKFEAALKRSNTRKPPQIYTENFEKVSIMPYSERHYSANDVLLNISKQITSLQNADSMRKDLHINYKMVKHKKNALIPVNMLSLDDNFPHKSCFTSNKFETQYVSDTQLINIVENAEKMVIPKGVTQEFENSFCEQLVEREGASKHLVDFLCYNDRYDKEVEPVEDLTIPTHSIIPSTSKGHNNNKAKNYSTNVFDAQKDKNENEETDIEAQNVNKIEESVKISSEEIQDFENSFCGQHVGKEEDSKIFANSLCHDRYDEDIELVTDLNIPICSIIPKELSTGKDHNTNEGNEALNYLNIFGTQKETNIEVQNVDRTQEIVKSSSVVVQDFENSVCEQNVERAKNNKILADSSCYNDRNEEDIELVKDLNIPVYPIISDVSCTSKDYYNNEENQAIYYSTNLFNNQKETNENIKVQNVNETQENVKNSPGLHSSNAPLIFTLDAFENFAALAFPVIEKNSNFEAAKYVINSQIIDRELFLGRNINKSTLQKEDRAVSPVLSIKKNSTSTLAKVNNVKKKLLKDPDKSIVLKQSISLSNEKKVKSNEDEILFSSDEEKDLQKLPLTCALQTSFNNQPDILDKTMYVGFQTASNKSIQINSDSLSKAKNIFEDVGIINDKFTLTEIVTTCDVCDIYNVSQLNKGHNNNVKNEAKSALKDITNIDGYEVNNKPKSSISGTNTISKASKSSLDLQTSNRKCEMNFEHVYLENEMQFDIETTDPNPKYSKIETALGKNLIKNRDLLEFHTASNKKINLTDKALARCRQVFADFDLDEKYDQTESENTRCCTQLNILPPSTNQDIGNFKENEVRKQSESTEIDDQSITKEFESVLLSNTKPENASSSMEFKNKILSRCLLDTEGNKNYVDTALNKKTYTNVSDIALQQGVDNKTCSENHTESSTKVNFIGFKTASNKLINISEKALTKTKNIFDDLDFREVKNSNTNLFHCKYKTSNNKDNKFFTEQNVQNDNNTKTGSEVENTQSVEDLEKKHVIIEKKSSLFDGLQTADKNSVKISSEELKRIAVTDFSCEVGKTLFKEFKTASNKPIKVSNEALIKTRNIFQDIDISSEINENSHNNSATYKLYKICSNLTNVTKKETNFEKENFRNEPDIVGGFKTASNKKMNISNVDLTKSKMLFQDMKRIYDHDGQNYALHSTFNKKQKTVFSVTDSYDKNIKFESLFSKNQNFQKLQDKTLEGFKSASNKQVPISDAALAKSKKLFQDIEINDKYNEHKVISELETVHNKHDFDENSQFTKNIQMSDQTFKGFKTASNKQVIISNEALAKSKKLFQDIEMNDKYNEHKVISELETVHNKHDFDENSQFTQNIQMSDQTFKGFKTASNKQIITSNEALAKSKKLFQDIEMNDKYNEHKVISELETVHNKHDFDENSQFTQNIQMSDQTFKGFKTASNKQIITSNEALAKSKKLFQDIEINGKYNEHKVISELETVYNKHDFNENSQFTKNIQMSDQTFKGYKTASNKQVNISNEALAKSKKLFQDIEMNDKYNEHKVISELETVHNKHDFDENSQFTQNIQMSDQTFKGFKTASNKQIITSNEALAKSKKLFQDIEMNDKYNEHKVISELETAHNKHDFNENSQFTKNIQMSDQTFKDFKTASNKQVNISNEALAKSKKLFQDIEINGKYNEHKIISELETVYNKHDFNENSQFTKNIQMSDQTFKGYKTASNKQVNISNEALAKSKKLFQDIEINDKYNEHKVISELETVHNKHDFNENSQFTKNIQMSDQTFKGFKTASNKQVNISNEALAKSKKLFQDIEMNDKYNEHKVISELETVHNKHDFNENTQFTKNIQMSDQTFKGFKTASNKQVNISNEALAKSKKLFQDIEINEHKVISELETVYNKHDFNENSQFTKNIQICDQTFKGFKTASKKPVNISNEALAKSKKLFQDIEINDKYNEHKVISELETVHNKHDFNENSQFTKNIQISDQIFKGFQTAGNKQVNISNEALAKYKKLFQDLDLNCQQNVPNELTTLTSHDKPINDGIEFRAANINISLESVTKPKKRKMDFKQNNVFLNVEKNNINETSLNTKENINLDLIIDTQVLNNFEETLNTEDFCKETKHNKSKRSGSPILLCPRAKKRGRFAIPFKTEHKITEKATINVTSESSTNILYVFNESYKKTKKYTLKTLRSTETLNSGQNEIDQYILNYNFDNVVDFTFSDKRNELTDDRWSIEDLKKNFLSLVNRKIIPDGWLDNHLKLIILKLISYEIEFRNTMQGICSVNNVLQQLKYRYDRELYNVERPALRKLLERDDVSTRTMILRVLAVYVDGVAVTSMTNGNNIELLLTDGWYCIKACLDQMLAKLVRDHKIRVGTKLATHGAELLNCEQGIAPWEDTSSVRLKIFGNSTRRARWDARLGYHGAGAILAPLSCVELEGGKVSKLRALVTRVYPTLYVEKFEDGSTVTRSERLEQLHQMKYESERQALLEKIYEEVGKEFADEESQDSECDTEVRTSLNSGSQIYRFMKQCKDPGEFRPHLTSSQCALLQDYTNKRREKLLQSIQTKVEERLKAKGLHVGRNVVPVLKIRIADVGRNGEISKAMMSVWRPNDAILDIIQEGSWINVYNIVPTAMRYSEVQLSAGRQTIFSRTTLKENDIIKPIITNLKRTCYGTKDLAMNPMITTDYNEVDTVGLIFLIDPSNEQFESVKGLFQNVYLTDGEKNVICINFWGGLKKFGYENVLDTGQVVACMNLQKRVGNTKKSIPQFRATEFSYFTKTSKVANVRKMTEELSKALSCVNIKNFCQECIAKKNNCSIIRNNCEKISPYRINYSDYNVSKHKMFIDSPLTRKSNPIEDILDLSGLDFESTFRQIDTQDISPSVLSRKKKVEEKIAKLKMYGEPPPLHPIHIINKSKNASNAFKSPLSSKNDTSNSVANEKFKDNTNFTIKNLESSPVIYDVKNCVKRKSFNPIKLNFSSDVPVIENNGSQVVDPFAEEFDDSPPLSLD